MAKRPVKKSYRVFLSHSHADRWIAGQIVRIIEEAGCGKVKVFIDTRDLTVKGKLDTALKNEIRASDEFLVLLTMNSRNRPWVSTEMDFAFAYDKPITGIVESLSSEQLPAIVFDYDCIDLNYFDDYIAKLMQRVRGRMKK